MKANLTKAIIETILSEMYYEVVLQRKYFEQQFEALIAEMLW